MDNEYIIIEGESGRQTAFKITTAKAYSFEYFISNRKFKNNWSNLTRVAKLNDGEFGVKKISTLSVKQFEDIFLQYIDKKWLTDMLCYKEEGVWRNYPYFNSKVYKKYGTIIAEDNQ